MELKEEALARRNFLTLQAMRFFLSAFIAHRNRCLARCGAKAGLLLSCSFTLIAYYYMAKNASSLFCD